MNKNNKEIEVLSDREHILLRPTVYVGSVKPTDEKIPVIVDGKLCIEQRRISVGMYKLFDEVFSNSLDEAKRMSGKMKKIIVSIDSKENSVFVQDTGNGFYKGTSINKKSGLSNIETAVSQLRAGSNFKNETEDIQESLVGTNGMGVSLVNVLSKSFSINTINESHSYSQEWKNFERNEPKVKGKGKEQDKGTTVKFIPLGETFGYSKWDKEILLTTLVLKYNLIKRDPVIGNLELDFLWDGVKIDLNIDFLPSNSFRIESEIGQIIVWEKYEKSGPISFVNSAICSGIHQKIVNDFINEKLEDTLGHHFYDTLIVLNLAPRYVKFGDQNKTKFVTPRDEVENPILNKFGSKLQGFFKTEMYERILKKVEDRKNEGYIKKLKSEKKNVNLKASHKYFPSQKSLGENLFIVEGLSAMGSILQKRDPKNDGVYSLKGKVKNCKNIGDLSDNKEILELMQILGLDPTSKNTEIHGYKKIIIATDPDPDGSHITSLLINFFYRWFPNIIKAKRLNMLKIPLVTVGDGKKKKYYWDMDEYKAAKVSGSVRYLKGLGSLALDDWEWVMKDKKLLNILETDDSKNKLEMAFGDSSDLRKKWLSEKV
jgi:DNA gyrase/topoisomerase IV subunit B